jgi:hypothetical protein
MTLFVATSHQIPQEGTMEPPISTPNEKTDDENNQEGDEKRLAIPKMVH